MSRRCSGGLFALHHRRHLYLVMGLSAGLPVGAALLDLLPEAEKEGKASWLFAAVVGGFALILAASRLLEL